MLLEEITPRVSKYCKRFNVKSLDAFGSYSREEASADSDLDLLVEFRELPPSEYAQSYFGLLHSLEDELHINIDLLTLPSIKRKSLLENLEKERIRIYES